MDGMASEKGGRVARDDCVSKVGQGNEDQVRLGSMMYWGKCWGEGRGGCRWRRQLLRRDAVRHRLSGCAGGGRGCGWLLSVDGLPGWSGWAGAAEAGQAFARWASSCSGCVLCGLLELAVILQPLGG